jgi:hypothetical protein
MSRTNLQWTIMALVFAITLGVAKPSPTNAAGAVHPACPIERARYVLRHDPRYTAGFYLPGVRTEKHQPLTFFIHSSVTTKTYWFFFDGGTARYTFLYSMPVAPSAHWTPPDNDDRRQAPFEDITFLSADHDYRFRFERPVADDSTPELLLISDLPAMFAAKGQPPEHPPLDFFRFDHCAKPGSPPG